MTTQNTNTISTCLWFDDQAEEAANFYISVFGDAGILDTTPYLTETPSDKSIGSTMTVDFKIGDQPFMALNGGPHFTPNPSISFFVNCQTEQEVDRLWERLSEGGIPLMPLDSYPFSEKYGWIQDKFGLSWQVNIAEQEAPQKIFPSLMFVGANVGKAEEAMNFYVSIFDDSEVDEIFPYGADQPPDREGTVAYGAFTLAGQNFAAMDSAQEHGFHFNEAISLVVNCATQEEIDYYWEKLSADPKAEQCGWLKDKFGVSWQVVPAELDKIFGGDDAEKSKQAMDAMLQMKKLDIAKLEQAYNQG